MITVPMKASVNGPVPMEASGGQNVPMEFSSAGPQVTSVNGKTGRVTLDAEDVHALPESTQIVTSVNGQTGEVNLTAEDIGALPSDFRDVHRVEYNVDTGKASLTASQIIQLIDSGCFVFMHLPVLTLSVILGMSKFSRRPASVTFAGRFRDSDYVTKLIQFTVADDASVEMKEDVVQIIPQLRESDAGKFIMVDSNGHLVATTMDAWQGGDY